MRNRKLLKLLSAISLVTCLVATPHALAESDSSVHVARNDSAASNHDSEAAPAKVAPPADAAAAMRDLNAPKLVAKPVQAESTATAATTVTTSQAGSASTNDDPMRCITAPEKSVHKCSSVTGIAAKVVNQCPQTVEVYICAMTAKGWDCRMDGGVEPGESWSQAWCFATTGEIFMSAKTKGSKEPLAKP